MKTKMSLGQPHIYPSSLFCADSINVWRHFTRSVDQEQNIASAQGLYAVFSCKPSSFLKTENLIHGSFFLYYKLALFSKMNETFSFTSLTCVDASLTRVAVDTDKHVCLTVTLVWRFLRSGNNPDMKSCQYWSLIGLYQAFLILRVLRYIYVHRT